MYKKTFYNYYNCSLPWLKKIENTIKFHNIVIILSKLIGILIYVDWLICELIDLVLCTIAVVLSFFYWDPVDAIKLFLYDIV